MLFVMAPEVFRRISVAALFSFMLLKTMRFKHSALQTLSAVPILNVSTFPRFDD